MPPDGRSFGCAFQVASGPETFDGRPTTEDIMAIGHHRGPAVGAARDEWSMQTALRMLADGYDAGRVISYLEAYGLSFFAAQGVVRELTVKK
jgi:hypothetical protein